MNEESNENTQRNIDHSLQNDERANRKSRTKFPPSHIKFLEKEFYKCKYPDCYQRSSMAKVLKVDESVIQTWFKNKRARTKNNAKNCLYQPNTYSYLCDPNHLYNSIAQHNNQPLFTQPQILYQPSRSCIKDILQDITNQNRFIFNKLNHQSYQPNKAYIPNISIPCLFYPPTQNWSDIYR